MEKEIIGYKWLARMLDGSLVSPVAARHNYVPLEQATWKDGHIEAHEMPKDDELLHFDDPGIHAHKNLDKAVAKHPVYPSAATTLVLVKVLLSGIVVEGEEGYRAQYADIVEIIEERTIEEGEWMPTIVNFRPMQNSLRLGADAMQIGADVMQNFCTGVWGPSAYFGTIPISMSWKHRSSLWKSLSPPPSPSFKDGIQHIHQVYLDIKNEED